MPQKLQRTAVGTSGTVKKYMNVGKVFIDSNIFIYLTDLGNPKQAESKRFLNSTSDSHIVISTQVLKEVSSVLLKKKKLSIPEVKGMLKFLNQYQIIETDSELIYQGIDLTASYSISFWDSLIVAAAKKGGCEHIITEDLGHSQQIEGITIENPFLQIKP